MKTKFKNILSVLLPVFLSVCLTLFLVSLPAVAQRGIPKSFADWLIAKKLTVTTGGADFQSAVTMDDVTLSGDISVDDLTATGNTALGNAASDTTSVTGEMTVTGGVTVTGDSVIGNGAGDTTSVTGEMTVTGGMTSTGNVVLGDAVSDTVSVAGDLSVADDVSITGDTSLSNMTASGDITVSGNIIDRSLYLRYQDVAAAPSIYAEAGVVSTTNSITTSILGIETPRNAIITWVTVTTATTGNITVAGIDARGSSMSELIAVGAVSGTQTLTGVVPWVSITSFSLPVRTEAVTLTVAGGQKFGLPLVPAAAGDVYHLTVNATPQAAPTVNATYGTFDPVSTPAANVDYNVWVKQ